MEWLRRPSKHNPHDALIALIDVMRYVLQYTRNDDFHVGFFCCVLFTGRLQWLAHTQHLSSLNQWAWLLHPVANHMSQVDPQVAEKVDDTPPIPVEISLEESVHRRVCGEATAAQWWLIGHKSWGNHGDVLLGWAALMVDQPLEHLLHVCHAPSWCPTVARHR